MGNHHEPLMALGPINWDDVPLNSLKLFANGILADAQTVIESIPAIETLPAALPASPAGRGRSKTDPQILSPESVAIAEQLRPEWKQVKTNPRDNPLDISVYKLASKDGKGAWFARRSIHDQLGFDKWKNGLEREFGESMKVQSGPGSGGIRGIGADRRVEDRPVEGVGNLQVFQLSARFPGPTAPRDFVTLLLTSESSQQYIGRSRPLRQYMIVSKPCVHPECPSQQGFIRGQYESVELVREVPMGPDRLPGKASALPTTDPDGSERRRSAIDYGQDQPTVIEWLMITRSDPGGSVPRFMVEKGTPPGIVGDAGKFVKWITSRSTDSLSLGTGPSTDNGTEAEVETEDGTESSSSFKLRVHSSPEDGEGSGSGGGGGGPHEAGYEDEQLLSTSGIYGIITGIYGVASSVVASGLRQLSSPAGSNASQDSLPVTEEPDDYEPGDDDDDDNDDNDDNDDDEMDNRTASSEASSIGTFASALEKGLPATDDQQRQQSQPPLPPSDSSPGGAASSNNGPLEKELRKLQERRRKLDDKAAQMHSLLESKRRGSKEKDDALIAKLRDKHDRELAKQEAKYRREMQKLEEKREQEERKAVARRRKAGEKEEKLALSLELERARVERDVALKQLEILKGQVGELQAQNTMLVARMGRMMVGVGGEVAAESESKGSGSPKLG